MEKKEEERFSELGKKINDLQEKINDIKEISKYDEPEKFRYIYILVAIFGLSFLFFIFAVFLNRHYDFGISGNSIVLTFVGIAATFVVVSNYAQVKDIERKFDSSINYLNENFEKKINEKEAEINNLNDLTMISLSDISKLIGGSNSEKGFYLNMIFNYIESIKRIKMIKEEYQKKHIKSSIETIEKILKNTDWNSYDFTKGEEFNFNENIKKILMLLEDDFLTERDNIINGLIRVEGIFNNKNKNHEKDTPTLPPVPPPAKFI